MIEEHKANKVEEPLVVDKGTVRRVLEHSGVSEEIIETAKEAVRQYQNFEEICVTRAGCTVSSHCGPGTIGVLFLHER